MNTIDLAFVAGICGICGNGVTAGRTNPGNRAHAFRMTLVAQGKLPQIIFCLRRVSHFFSKPSSCLGLLFLNFCLRGVSHFFSRPWPHPVSLLTNFFPLFFAFAVSPASFPGLCPVSCYFSLTFAFVLSRTSFPNLGRVSC